MSTTNDNDYWYTVFRFFMETGLDHPEAARVRDRVARQIEEIEGKRVVWESDGYPNDEDVIYLFDGYPEMA